MPPEPEPEPAPGSTGGAPRAPSAPVARTYVQRYVVLADWWLERLDEGKVCIVGTHHDRRDLRQMRNEASSAKGNRESAGQVLRSAAIVKRHADNEIETEDGYLVRIGRLVKIPEMRKNGFSQKVCEYFELGFPIRWRELVDPNIEQQNEQARSQPESTANAPSHSLQYRIEKLDKYLSDSVAKPNLYPFMECDFYSYVECTSNTDGPATQSTSNLSDGNVGNTAASCGLHSGSKDMPEKPLTPPGETCSGQESDQHESMRIDASEQEIVNRSISSVSVTRSTGSICANSKVDDGILAPSKLVSVEKEGYRNGLGCGQAEEDTDTQHERMTPQFGAVRDSEASTLRKLRNGKIFGSPSGGSMKRGYKKKKIHHQTMIPNEGCTSTADLTSHENDSSAVGIVTDRKKESHDSHRKAQRRRRSGGGRAVNCSGTFCELCEEGWRMTNVLGVFFYSKDYLS